MADLVSTNKTDFFRETRHFELLVSRVLPDLCRQEAFAAGRVLRCRSAGCSTGQEAWSVAMTLDDYRERCCPDMDYSILGTDISSRVLKTAGEAIYPFRQSAGIPVAYLKKYVLKSKDSTNPRIRIDNRLRAKVTFAFENLMDLQYRNNLKFHLVFIRNTLIYFDRDNQERILKKMLDQMQPGGYLFVGHSESLVNMDLPISHVATGLYQKLNA
jgi:chemotaxis protein methyltransferase CheR